MSENLSASKRIAIPRDFFCDGLCYLLTSRSLGGSGETAESVSEALSGDETKMRELVGKGICLPVCFQGDCALDQNTLFVLGELNEEEERDWIARMAWKLNIPCGNLVLCCGCESEDLVRAVSGEDPAKGYEIYQNIEVPPGEYLTEIYAYLSSPTVQVSLDEYDDEGEFVDNREVTDWYNKNRPGRDDIGYIIRLSPLETEPKMPELVDGWFEGFEFRPI